MRRNESQSLRHNIQYHTDLMSMQHSQGSFHGIAARGDVIWRINLQLTVSNRTFGAKIFWKRRERDCGTELVILMRRSRNFRKNDKSCDLQKSVKV